VLSLRSAVRVFVARGATDLRRSFDRLAAEAETVLRQDPFSGHVFCFFNRRRDPVLEVGLAPTQLRQGCFSTFLIPLFEPIATLPTLAPHLAGRRHVAHLLGQLQPP